MIRRARYAATTAVAVLLTGAMVTMYTPHAQNPSLSRSPVAPSVKLSSQLLSDSEFGQVSNLSTVNLAEYQACARASYPAPSPVSGVLAGYSDIAKLSGATPVGFPALALVDSGPNEGLTTASPPFHNQVLSCNLVILQLDDHGSRQLPPITTTLLGFRFVPVTATAILTETAPLRSLIFEDEGPTNPPTAVDTSTPFTAVSVASLELRLADVRINGVPLDVGSSCRSNGILFTPDNQIAPGELVLTGGTNLGDPSPSFGQAVFGGTVAGEADIPPFTGCITPSGENLDALLSASVSGPGNFLRMTIGPLCPFTTACTPTGLPTLQDAPLWTVTHGGQYSASAPLTLTGEAGNPTINQISITCSQSQISGLFPDVTGPLRGGLATVQWNQIGGCTGSDGSTWQVTQQGAAYFGPKFFGQEGLPPGETSGNIDQIALTLTGTKVPGLNGTCHLFMAGYQPTTYSNTGSVLTLGGLQDIHIFESNCPDAPADGGANGAGDFGLTGTYQISPRGITVTSP